MKSKNKAKRFKPEKHLDNKSKQKKIAMEHSIKKRRWIIVALSIIVITCIVLIIFFVISQKQSIPSQNNMNNAETTINKTDSLNGQPITTTNQVPINNNPNPLMNQQAAPNIPATNVKGNPNSSEINPAHGQPGHRCDIPVGSPLNAPPANTAPKTNNSASAPPANTTPLTNNSTSAPAVENSSNINPAHGEPGHRCEIPVGSPLN